MEWWAWLIIAVTAVFIIMAVVAFVMAILSYRQASRQVRLHEQRLGSPLRTIYGRPPAPPARGRGRRG